MSREEECARASRRRPPRGGSPLAPGVSGSAVDRRGPMARVSIGAPAAAGYKATGPREAGSRACPTRAEREKEQRARRSPGAGPPTFSAAGNAGKFRARAGRPRGKGFWFFFSPRLAARPRENERVRGGPVYRRVLCERLRRPIPRVGIPIFAEAYRCLFTTWHLNCRLD